MAWKNVLSFLYVIVDFIWFLYNVGKSRDECLKEQSTEVFSLHLKDFIDFEKILEITDGKAKDALLVIKAILKHEYSQIRDNDFFMLTKGKCCVI
jgi:hypothetical protein